jgi:hypothetical protein
MAAPDATELRTCCMRRLSARCDIRTPVMVVATANSTAFRKPLVAAAKATARSLCRHLAALAIPETTPTSYRNRLILTRFPE